MLLGCTLTRDEWKVPATRQHLCEMSEEEGLTRLEAWQTNASCIWGAPAMTATIDTASRLAGAVWGHLVGDAVGVQYEFKDAGETGGVCLGEPRSRRSRDGPWSDSGALMLALLDVLLEASFDPEDQGRRALAWHRDGAYTPNSRARPPSTRDRRTSRPAATGRWCASCRSRWSSETPRRKC